MEISYATSSNLDIVEGDTINGAARQVRVAPLEHPTPSSPGLPPSSPLFSQWRAKLRAMSAMDWMELLLPCSRWIRTYQWAEYLQVDIMAGITVGVMLVPQAMSYAKLAGLHPIYGLYSGFVPIFVYGIFGSSRQLAIGPVTLVSLLVSNVLSNIVSPKEELYTELAILLAFMVGALECTMGLLRLGWLLRFISHSVISGFITSSAIIIALSQAKYFLGYNIERSSQIVPLAKSIIAGVGNGDPVWAIKSNTVNDLVGLSINFFFILPLANLVGIHIIQAPVLHPVAEGLFNFVIGWTFMFAPLLFSDRRRGRFKGSLDLLWGFQMFLTNTFLIPYMAIRLNNMNNDMDQSPPKPSQLGLLMTNGAQMVSLIGGIMCVVSVVWALFGRSESGFGDFADRWRFMELYISSERLAYAFIWDIFLYAIFQPWLIGDNLQNVKSSDKELVSVLRYIPVLGLVAYLLCLDGDSEL